MKAWKLTDDAEYVEYVTAETRNKAKSLSRAITEDGEHWTNIRATRAPPFDDKVITDKLLYETGEWWFECRALGCHTEIGLDGVYHEGDPEIVGEEYTQPFYDDDGSIYCSEKCRDRQQARNHVFRSREPHKFVSHDGCVNCDICGETTRNEVCRR